MAFIIRKRIGDRSDDSEVSGPLLQIGRAGTANLLLDDDGVALEHARINQEDGRYVLTAQDSITGTYVNGRRVQAVILSDGDRVTIGPFLLEVHIPGPGEPLSLDISPVAASAQPERSRVEAEKIDYAAAYTLSRKFLFKTLLFLLLVGALLGSLLWHGKTNFFRPGSVSDAHALFTNQCARCHVPWHGPSEQTCVECHFAPVHHKEQIFSPSCFSCHAEHRDQQTLTAVMNQQCVQCHATLKTKSGKPSVFVKKITDFTQDHPEFAITAKVGSGQKRLRLNDKGARESDLATLKLNHKLHLKRNLKGPKGPVQLKCKDCHRPASDGMLMAQVTYEGLCKDCHKLEFDSDLPGRQVPHATFKVIHGYLIGAYSQPQDEIVPYPERSRRLPGKTLPSKLSPSIIQKVWEAEKYLVRDICYECHKINAKNRPLPKVEKTNTPVIWLPHSRFSHKAHRMLECTSCHMEVSTSLDTEDVLLPGIQTCQNCHRKAGEAVLLQKARAPTDCSACHNYHDKSGDRDWDGPFTVKRLLNEEKTGDQPVRKQTSIQRYLRALGINFGKDR